MKWLSTWICLVVLSLPALGGQFKMPSAEATPEATHEVPGLKLPAAQTVNYDEGFVSLTADCKGTVKWLVLSSSVKVKFKILPTSPKDIDVAIPPYQSAITVFCVGVVDGKQTDFARTDIMVKGPPGPGSDPQPAPETKGPFHLSVIEDPPKRTEAIRALIENQDVFRALHDKQIIVRIYNTTEPAVKTNKFDGVLRKYGAPLLVLQDNAGHALVVGKFPADTASLYQMISPYVGSFEK